MNYALDAIWWRLRHPAARDLAAILTAPPLWHSGCELPVSQLLGEHGFRFLLALDSAPTPLQHWLEQEAPFGHRLGHYAESLLAFWLTHAPHCRLIARNHPIRDENGRTLGAADFLCLIGQQPHHLELTCKYYGGRSPSDLRGLNPTDTLPRKAAKLEQQSRLLLSPAAQAQLPDSFQGYLKSPHALLHTATLVRGIGFTPSGTLNDAPLNPLGWSGLLLADWADYLAQPQQRFHPLPRLAYLAPARIPIEHTLSATELAHQPPGLAAVVEPRPDGLWHETQRLMRLP
ncbi:DUF1853 family protein [Eikenella sp. S3360]|uniref:DUF1853 family protein n=1 Tax=Eikenella glucosivorans TaxID=2766967 RepID=A0ABS0NCA5_9NEIS|nr:DUF1853 family protein [Eikenella glucosivorans]MBH5329892.1 DUF1853 family protein [Eikenella glucosivorans]